MKSKYLISCLILFYSIKINAQIGINTTTPNIDLAIVDSNTGFNRTTANRLAVLTNNVERIIIDNDHVGINVNSPTYKFEIDTKMPDNTDGYLKISTVTTGDSTENSFLVIENTTGELGYKIINSHAGQFMRIGINNELITTSPNQQALRFNSHYTPNQMGNSPSGTLNYQNTIAGATFNIGQSLSAGAGTIDRTTDQINLPKGVYRITIKFTGHFNGANDHNHLDIKIIVNNNEYSFANCVISGNGNTNVKKSGIAVETIVLEQPESIDFTFVRDVAHNTITPMPRKTIGSNYVYESYILIEKLQ